MNPEPPKEPGQKPIQRPDVEARAREFERIAKELAEVREQMAANRRERPVFEPTKEDREFREAWDAMSEEERDEWLRQFQQGIDEHREEIEAIPGLEPLLGGLRRTVDCREKLIGLEEELIEMMLQTHADYAEASARQATSVAELMQHWENLTEEQWQSLPPEDRGNLMDMLNEWNGGMKEEYLAELPIEVRRRFE